MTWSRAIELREFERRGWICADEHSLIYVTDCNRRTAMIERRARLARHAVRSLNSRLSLERTAAWTVINRQEAERFQIQQILARYRTPPHATDEAERAAVAATPTEET